MQLFRRIVAHLLACSTLVTVSTCHNQHATSAAGPYNGFCPAASWPLGPGRKVTSQQPSEDLKDALKKVSAKNIQSYIETLVSFGTRHTLSTQDDPKRGIGAARDWIAETMRGFAARSQGRMDISIQSYIQQPDGDRITFPVKISNVVATIKGSETPERHYFTSGHYDSRVTDILDYTSDAPGADDDASGVAAVLEMVRILATKKPKSTLVLAAVAGEEQNLYGSTYAAETFKNSSINIAGVLNVDTIGASVGDDGSRDAHTLRVFCAGTNSGGESSEQVARRLTVGGENDTPARELGRFVIEVAQNAWTGMRTIALIYRLDRFLRGGDHRPFIQNGFLSAVRFTEALENFDHQHQDVRKDNGTQYGDLIKYVDFDYNARAARVNLASLWSLSEAPAEPQNVFVNTTALDNNSQFVWQVVTEPGLAGFEVVWRASASPFWTHAIPVNMGLASGPNRTTTVNVSKDDVVFGMRSVGTNGMKSPAVFAQFPL